MKVLITGATGFLGRALTLRLQREGHSVVAWVRSPERARQSLGADVELVSVAAGDPALRAAVEAADAIVNLAGEPVLPKRWTAERKAVLVSSRVGTTTRVVDAIAAASRRPTVLVSASAVGYYGDRGEERVDEISPPGSGFLAELCQQWETAALRARDFDVRVAVLRIGVVLGRDGGALPQMLPAFRLGLGGPLGSGQQRMPWIHVRDLVEILARAVVDPRWTGPINATAPRSVRHGDFARALGAALGRPALLPAPEPLLRLALGQGAEALLQGLRVDARRLRELGFEHRYKSLEEAFADLLREDACGIEPARALPEAEYVRLRRPRWLLTQDVLVGSPRAAVFDFFSKAENLGAMTPSGMSFEIASPQPIAMGQGTTIRYRIRIGPFPLQWVTLIEEWEPGRRFTDSQQVGPYRCWWHEHAFRDDEGGTRMTDRVWYSIPVDPFGLVNRFVVAPRLRRIFGHRRDSMDLRFGLR